MVDRGDWGHGKNCTLFMFDSVANGCTDSQRLNHKQTGDLQFSLEFGVAPVTNITVLVYGEFENLLEIDSNGAVLYDIYQLKRKKMEQVALKNLQLDYLARDDPQLKVYFYGTVACDRLPKAPDKKTPRRYIVNTDPHDQPGQHWLAIWTCQNVCEVMYSYALPLERYEQVTPLREWIVRHWKYVVTNGKSLQAVNSKSCGDYALLYFKTKVRGRTLQEFLNDFSDYDYESNDHKAGQRVKQLIVANELILAQSVSKPLSSALLLIKG